MAHRQCDVRERCPQGPFAEAVAVWESLHMVNKVILVGRLGKDPELRYTQGGQAVANFTIATNESWNNKEGERQERTEWHRIVAWGKQAEFCSNYLSKGRQ